MIFVLGGSGFIGSAICRYLATKLVPYQAITRENYTSFIGRSCDILINANGNSKKYISEKNPIIDFDLSVRSVRSSIEDFEFSKYIYLSSCDVYSDCSSHDLTQEDFPLAPALMSNYGFHKYLSEEIIKGLVDDWIIVRMGGFVGPGLKKNPVFDILNNQKLWLHPDSQLQYLHIDSLASILYENILHLKKQIINVAGYGTVKLRDVMKYCDYNGDISDATKLVIYDVSTDKLQKLRAIPKSTDEVFSFIRNGT